MKKKIFGGIAVLAIAIVIAVNVSLSNQNNGLSDISLANVEALANNEVGSTCGTNTSYEHRREYCGGNNRTSLHITCYSRSSGGFSSYSEGCRVTGWDCYNDVNTNTVETRPC